MQRLCIAVTTLLGMVAGAEASPVVAVDDLHTRGAKLPEKVRGTLSLYLATRVSAIEGLRVIPRRQVRELMTRLKRQAVAKCGEGPCPVELGRELAANKVLVPQVIGAAGSCVVTLTFYDVRSATAEAASTANAHSCDDAALALAITAALDQLAAKLRQKGPATRPATSASQPERVSVYFTSWPQGAPISVDGEKRGNTPLRIDLEAGQRHEVTVGGNFPYAAVHRTVVAKDWERIHVKLELEPIDPLERATATEWFSFGLGSGFFRAAERPLFAVAFRAATFKWRYLFVSVVDFFVGINSSGREEEYKLWRSLSIGSRAGFPLYLGSSKSNQLLLGLGVHYSMYEEPDVDDRSMLTLIPGVEYAYSASNGAFLLGGGVHAVVPVAGQLGDAPPFQLMFTLRVGLSLSPMIRSHQRKQRSGKN